MKPCISSYSFQSYLRDGRMTQLDCVAQARRMGFDAIEFTDLAADTQQERLALAARIREQARALGMTIVAYAVGATLYHDTQQSCEEAVRTLMDKVDVAHALEAHVLRHDVCYKLASCGRARSFDGMLPTIAENARRVSAYAQTLGIRTCTENHGFIAQDSDRVQRLFAAVDHDNYGLLVDIGNFLCVDEDPATAVSRVAPYAVHVHVKDFTIHDTPRAGAITTRGCRYIVGAPLGEGDVPVLRCLQILGRAGYDGYVTLEYEAAQECMTGIARSFSNLQQMLSTLE